MVYHTSELYFFHKQLLKLKNCIDIKSVTPQSTIMMEYTGGSSSPLYTPQPQLQEASNGISPETEVPTNPLLGGSIVNPTNGIKTGGTDPGLHGYGRGGSMASTLGATNVPSGQQQLPEFTNTGFPMEKQQLLYKSPSRPSGRSTFASPRKAQLSTNIGDAIPCYVISCADGLPDDPKLKQYINTVTLAIQTSDPQANVIDLEFVESNAIGTPAQKRENSIKLIEEKCDALVCCIPTQCSLERWLRAIVEAREMFMNGCTVLALVDPNEKTPVIFIQNTTKIFTDLYMLERYIAGRSRRRAIAARNAAAGR